MNLVNFTLENEILGARKLNNFKPNNQINRKTRNVYAKTSSFDKIYNTDNFTRRLPGILQEHEFDLKGSNLNKIFCSQWLDDRRVLMGTKCNRLVSLDTLTGKHSIHSPLKSHAKSVNVQNHCGIHSIAINPSRTLLATGAENVNDIAVYSLPNLEPVAVGYAAHSYWIFDFVWLDDNHVCSGAGDNRLALWKIDTDSNENSSSAESKVFSAKESSVDFAAKASSSKASSSLFRSELGLPTSNRRIKRLMPINRTFLDAPPIHYHTRSNHHQRSASSIFHPHFTNNFYRHNRFTYNRNNFNCHHHQHTNSTASASSTNRNRYNSANFSLPFGISRFREQTQSSYFDNYPMSFDYPEMPNYENSEFFNQRYSPSQPNDFNNRVGEGEAASGLRWHANSEAELNAESNRDRDDDDEEEDEDHGDNEGDDRNWIDVISEEEVDNEPEQQAEQQQENVADGDEDDEGYVSFKRRRLNSCGRFKNSNGMKYMKPLAIIKCQNSKRIRALAYNSKRNQIGTISMNSTFNLFDVAKFEQNIDSTTTLPTKENVCLAINSDNSMYAVGSASHVNLLDANNTKQIVQPVLIKDDIGVRSVHFRNDVLSIGTGIGTVLFYDIRASKFLENSLDSNKEIKLQTNGGWILRNETFYDSYPYVPVTDNTHAIYSHSYDPSGTKIFTAGGPLTVQIYGHYAAVWR